MKILRKGDAYILKVRGFSTPKRWVFWNRQVTGNGKGMLFPLIFLAVCFSMTFKDPALSPIWGYFFGAIFFALLAMRALASFGWHWLSKFIGGLLLGKKTVIEFLPDQVKLYRHGYGMGRAITWSRTLENPIMANIDVHDDAEFFASEANGNSSHGMRTKASVYKQAYHVRMVIGGEALEVAEVLGKQFATRFANMIMKADENLRNSHQVKEEIQEEIQDLPE